jgi:hypothetical protein
VAVAYYGQTAEQVAHNGTVDGYLTVTPDATSGAPTFFTATVNDPGDPLLPNTATLQSQIPGYLDFNGADVAADGTAWGSYVQACPSGAQDAACANDGSTSGPLGTRGFAGRLVVR